MIPGATPSPCNSVCRMDAASGWCLGCLRTLDEIAAWSRLDEAGKQALWSRLHERRASDAGRALLAQAAGQPTP